MIILWTAVCAAVELFWIIKRSTSVIESTRIYLNGVDKIIETPVSITLCNRTAPQTAASKMIIHLNQHHVKGIRGQREHQ